MDTSCIVAALLHDVVEDTKVTRKQIKEMFGSEIARLVDGVTKINRLKFNKKNKQLKNKKNVQIKVYLKVDYMVIKNMKVMKIKNIVYLR